MYEAVSFAKHSIYLEMYIFSDDMEEFNFLELFKQKARNGVSVSIILDSYGSGALTKDAILDLRASGVELFFISYLFHHTHRKILIIDEKVAFVGGVNLHQSASGWNDLMVELRGKIIPLVLKSFARAYEACGGKDFFILRHKEGKKMLSKQVHFWLIEHSPLWKKHTLKKIYKENIVKAEISILLVTPYFMPKRWLVALLHQAILRGVRVEILMPKFTDHYFIDRVNYFFMAKLSRLGVKFYLEKDMNHAKLMIVDQKKGMVGSHNLDYLSFDYNSEAGVFFNDPRVVKKLVDIFENWKSTAVLFDHKVYKPNFLDYILSPIFSFFSKIL